MASLDNVSLIGMPAVGKSTVGVLLAKRLGFAFIDTDLLIQTGERQKLQQIILQHGVEAFCDLEAATIEKITARQSVISTGGSVVYRPRAMSHLQALGTIVFLDIELIPLKQRLGNLDTRGVIHLPGQSIDTLYAQRRPLYQRYAHHTLACTDLSPEATVRALVSMISKHD